MKEAEAKGGKGPRRDKEACASARGMNGGMETVGERLF